MEKIIWEAGTPVCSLHDMQVNDFRIEKDRMILCTSTGLVRTVPPCGQQDGHVEFFRVNWDFSYAYLLRYDGLAGNTGTFQGEKMFLKEFLRRFPTPDYMILDETYGYHQAKYSGFFQVGKEIQECLLEICYDGDLAFVIQE